MYRVFVPFNLVFCLPRQNSMHGWPDLTNQVSFVRKKQKNIKAIIEKDIIFLYMNFF